MCLIDDCCERKSVDLVVKFLEVNMHNILNVIDDFAENFLVVHKAGLLSEKATFTG